MFRNTGSGWDLGQMLFQEMYIQIEDDSPSIVRGNNIQYINQENMNKQLTDPGFFITGPRARTSFKPILSPTLISLVQIK